MREEAGGARLLFKAPQAFHVFGKSKRQCLDGDVATKAFIPSAVHLAHAAGADELDDRVGTELVPTVSDMTTLPNVRRAASRASKGTPRASGSEPLPRDTRHQLDGTGKSVDSQRSDQTPPARDLREARRTTASSKTLITSARTVKRVCAALRLLYAMSQFFRSGVRARGPSAARRRT